MHSTKRRRSSTLIILIPSLITLFNSIFLPVYGSEAQERSLKSHLDSVTDESGNHFTKKSSIPTSTTPVEEQKPTNKQLSKRSSHDYRKRARKGSQNSGPYRGSGGNGRISEEAQRWLKRHNSYRAQYSSPALQWDHTLAARAKSETNRCTWRHTPNDGYGENIAAGQTSIEDVIDQWVNGENERHSYSPSNPVYSHFTQVVWASTRRVGCSVTSCSSIRGSGLPQSPVYFWACEYYPSGNVDGEYHQNVKASHGGSPL